MLRAAFTVDVDRDVNEPRSGQLEGCTRSCPAPRFTSTLQGLKLLVELLNELGIRGTFFLEGEIVERWGQEAGLKDLLSGHEAASHGYAHEDLTGESTGIRPSPDWIDAIVGRSLATIEDVLGRRPIGFRAPYQHIDTWTMSVLARRGFLYDSTLFADNLRTRPYLLPDGMVELPIAQGRALDGKRMQSYLWPMHEGKRTPADYIHLLSQQNGELMIMADHSWHILESLEGPRTEEQVQHELDKVRAVLKDMLRQGVEFMTLDDYVRRGFKW